MEDALAILQAENAVLRAQLAERNAALDVANAQIEALTFNLAVLRRRQFGQSSERLAAEIEQLELRLEDLEESRAEQRAEQPESEQPDPVTRKSRKRYANSGGLDGVAHVSEGRRGTQCANLHTIEGVTMADDAKTWIEFEVLQCEETGFRVAGESEAVGWLSFDIRQPRYPRRSADITIIHSQGPTPGSAGSSASQDGASPSPNETTRKSFSNNMIGALVVRSREKSAIVRADLPIGVFEYSQTWTIGDHTEPEGYKISVNIATEDFDRLQNWAFSGRHPSLITIRTPDISYDYIGDYRVLEWEISGTFGRAAIFDISFEYNPSPLPVIVISDQDSFAKQERAEAESETRQAIATVVDKTASIAAELRGVNSQLRTLITVVIALACFLVFRLGGIGANQSQTAIWMKENKKGIPSPECPFVQNRPDK